MKIFPHQEFLEDPPRPEQLLAWASTREIGRALFIFWGVLYGTSIGVVIWFAVQCILYVFSERGVFHGHLNIETVGFILLASFVGGLNFRSNWQINEKIYLTAIERVEQPTHFSGEPS